MCFPSAPKDNSAALARQREEERQARIDDGQSRINAAFDSAFTPQFFTDFRSDVLDFQTPQLQDQFDAARRQAILRLAGGGNLASSAGARQLGDIRERFTDAQTQIQDQALRAEQDLRARIENEKSQLFSLNSSAADPSLAATRAAASIGGLQAPPAISPLGNVFADLLNTAAAGVAAERQGRTGLGTGLFNTTPSTQGSQRIIS